jgi:hypothetical protein
MPRPTRIGTVGHRDRRGILGRRYAPPAPVSPDGLELIARQLASPDLVLRRLAAEVSEIVRNPAGAVLTRPVLSEVPNDRGFPGVQNQVFPSPPNPDPKRLRWDPEKRAFRLKSHPAKCDCAGRRSALTGEPLDCGICDGRKGRPARFLPGPAPAPCRYCGRPSAYGWSSQICLRCERHRAQIETAVMSRHSVAAQRGRTGPTTIGDDALLVTIQRRLAQSENRNANLEEKAVKKAKRLARSAKWAEAAE